MAEPPLLVGGCHLMVALVLPALADTLAGALGKVLGVTGDAVAIEPPPILLTARTRSVTGVPFGNPVNVWERALGWTGSHLVPL